MTTAEQADAMRAALDESLATVQPHRSVSVLAGSLRAVGIVVDKSIPDDRPVAIRVGELRAKLGKK